MSDEIQESRNPVDSVNTDHVQDIKIISDPIPDPNYNFGPTEKILEILPALEAQTFMSDEWKKNRRIKLFNDRHFYAKYLIKKKENGTYDYENMIKHIHFLEECIKDLKTEQQAFLLAKTWHIENENLEARAKISEEDKKYTPKYKEREAKENAKKPATKIAKVLELAAKYNTSNENAGKILNLISLGIAEDAAKSIILGAK